MAEIALTKGLVALVDDEDAERLCGYHWFAAIGKGGDPYAARCVVRPDGKRGFRRMHHDVLELPTSTLVDHRDGDGLNNRRRNLRPATPLGNAQNTRPNPEGTCHFKGVSRARNGLWQARICANYQHRQLGTFSDPIEAARVYDAAAKELHGEFAWLNADHFSEVANG